MDGMTGDPPFLFYIFRGDLTMIAYAKFNGYFSNVLLVLDVTVTLLTTLLCQYRFGLKMIWASIKGHHAAVVSHR